MINPCCDLQLPDANEGKAISKPVRGTQGKRGYSREKVYHLMR